MCENKRIEKNEIKVLTKFADGVYLLKAETNVNVSTLLISKTAKLVDEINKDACGDFFLYFDPDKNGEMLLYIATANEVESDAVDMAYATLDSVKKLVEISIMDGE